MRITMILEGHRDLLRNVQQLRASVTSQGATNAWNGAQHLFARTRAVVPWLTGELYESAYMVNIGSKHFPMWAVGYDTVAVPHALAVHEIPNRVHPTRGPSSEPKQDHYLSQPRDEMVKTFVKDVASGMQNAIARTPVRRSSSRRGR